jgi:putative ABC transport system substrate-binding protein
MSMPRTRKKAAKADIAVARTHAENPLVGTVDPKRRKAITALLALASPGFGSPALGQRKAWRIGFLGVGSASAYAYRIDALRAGLRNHGYTEGQNVVMEYRWANGNTDLLPALAQELLQAKIDVLVTHAIAGTSAARQATSTMPIVITDIADIVATGLVTNLARPGGNITGSSFQASQLNAKRLELLKGALPSVVRVGFLLNPSSPITEAVLRETQLAAKAMNVSCSRLRRDSPAISSRHLPRWQRLALVRCWCRTILFLRRTEK